MHLPVRMASLCAFLLLIGSAAELGAQERRDSTRRATATSAEEMHRIRRAWLEQRRLGQLGSAPPVYGSAVVSVPRSGSATGIAVGDPLMGYGPPFGYGPGSGQFHGGFQDCGFSEFPGWSAGFGGRAGHAWGYAGSSFGRCSPFAFAPFPGLPFFDPRVFGFADRDGLPLPAYPLYGRFYERFDPDAYRRDHRTNPLLYGIQEYDWGWWGPRRTYPGIFGWADGAYGWYSAPPWSGSPADCVDLTIALANGRAHRVQLGLQSLGLADARDLDLAIDARLSEGSPVLLQGMDGRMIRIDPGTPIDDILVRPCGG